MTVAFLTLDCFITRTAAASMRAGLTAMLYEITASFAA
jgi:hypothetical protein